MGPSLGRLPVATVLLLLTACGLDPSAQQLAQAQAQAQARRAAPSPAATAPSPSPSLSPSPPPTRLAAPPPTASGHPSPVASPVAASPSPSGPAPAAWVPRPVASGGPDPSLAKAEPGLRRCTADDLRVRVVTDHPAPEPARRTLVLAATAVGATDCSLDDHGFGLGLPGSDVQPASASTADLRPDDLVRPADRLVLVGHLISWCDDDRGPLRLSLRDGDRDIPVEGTVTPPGCAAERYGSDRPQGGVGIHAVTRPGSPLLLVPRLDAPTTAEAGGVLAYGLRLTNASDAPVRLDDCPAFTHALGRLGQQPDEGRTTQSHLLPCDVLPRQVAPGASVAVDGVRLPVPRTTGRLTLGWGWGAGGSVRSGEQWDGVRGTPVDVR